MPQDPPQLPESRTVPPAAPRTPKPGLLENRSALFVLMFCVMGFLAIPLIFKSPAFSTAEKWFWSVVVTLYTCVLIAITVIIVRWSWQTISQSLAWNAFQLWAS